MPNHSPFPDAYTQHTKKCLQEIMQLHMICGAHCAPYKYVSKETYKSDGNSTFSGSVQSSAVTTWSIYQEYSQKTPQSSPVRASYGGVFCGFSLCLIFCLSFCNDISIDGLVQERYNSIANTLELHLSFTNPAIYITLLYYSNPRYIFPGGCSMKTSPIPRFLLVAARVWGQHWYT